MYYIKSATPILTICAFLFTPVFCSILVSLFACPSSIIPAKRSSSTSLCRPRATYIGSSSFTSYSNKNAWVNRAISKSQLIGYQDFMVNYSVALQITQNELSVHKIDFFHFLTVFVLLIDVDTWNDYCSCIPYNSYAILSQTPANNHLSNNMLLY